jgi:hypothetical protein
MKADFNFESFLKDRVGSWLTKDTDEQGNESKRFVQILGK